MSRMETGMSETKQNGTKNDGAQQPSIEALFQEIEETLEKMRQEELPLEDSFVLYKRGMEQLKDCAKRIDTVEKQVLTLNGEGELDDFQ